MSAHDLASLIVTSLISPPTHSSRAHAGPIYKSVLTRFPPSICLSTGDALPLQNAALTETSVTLIGVKFGEYVS